MPQVLTTDDIAGAKTKARARRKTPENESPRSPRKRQEKDPTERQEQVQARARILARARSLEDTTLFPVWRSWTQSAGMSCQERVCEKCRGCTRKNTYRNSIPRLRRWSRRLVRERLLEQCDPGNPKFRMTLEPTSLFMTETMACDIKMRPKEMYLMKEQMSGGAREQRVCARFAIVTRVHFSVAEVVGWERWLGKVVGGDGGEEE